MSDRLAFLVAGALLLVLIAAEFALIWYLTRLRARWFGRDTDA